LITSVLQNESGVFSSFLSGNFAEFTHEKAEIRCFSSVLQNQSKLCWPLSPSFFPVLRSISSNIIAFFTKRIPAPSGRNLLQLPPSQASMSRRHERERDCRRVKISIGLKPQRSVRRGIKTPSCLTLPRLFFTIRELRKALFQEALK
jgi:hypothetical protein